LLQGGSLDSLGGARESMNPMSLPRSPSSDSSSIPPLEAGDRLTRDEFERRCSAMPELKKAELIEGVYLARVLDVLAQGTRSGEHEAFVARLGDR